MPYDILLFDADGTLLDFNRAEETAFRAVFKAHGYSYLPESLAQYREINDRLWREYELKIVTQQSSRAYKQGGLKRCSGGWACWATPRASTRST